MTITPTREEVEAFLADIRAACKKHNLGLSGTCNSESIFGEITIERLEELQESRYSGDYKLDYYDNEFSIGVIIPELKEETKTKHQN